MPERDAAIQIAADVSLVRRPVLDRANRVVGYELSTARDGAPATRDTLHSAVNVIGIERLIGAERKLYMHTTGASLLAEDYRLLPPSRTVLILNASAEADSPLRKACRSARQAGYGLALSEYSVEAPAAGLLEAVDLIHIAIDELTVERGNELAATGRTLLAAGVDTREQYTLATAHGFELVQGFFFCKPESISGRAVAGTRATHLQLLTEVNQPEVDFDRLGVAIKSDVALTMALLKFVNSPAIGVRERITSIKHALHLIGERQVRKWASIVSVTALAHDKPHELLVMSLVRGRFCESLTEAPVLAATELDLFLTGLLSLIDAVVDAPLESAIAELPLDGAVRDALTGCPDSPLTPTLSLVSACERGAWTTAESIARQLQLPPRRTLSLYYDALGWVLDVLGE